MGDTKQLNKYNFMLNWKTVGLRFYYSINLQFLTISTVHFMAMLHVSSKVT